MSIKSPTEYDLQLAAQQNIHDFQVGDQRDGVSEDVARDLGYNGFDAEEIATIARSAVEVSSEVQPEQVKRVARAVGRRTIQEKNATEAEFIRRSNSFKRFGS